MLLRELQWRVEEANLEIFILRGSSHSLCKELVRSPSVVRLYPQKDKVAVLTPLGPREVTAALIGEHQKSKKIVV